MIRKLAKKVCQIAKTFLSNEAEILTSAFPA